MNGALKEYLRETGRLLEEQRKLDPPFLYGTEELMEGTYAYFLRGGKRLRPGFWGEMRRNAPLCPAPWGWSTITTGP